MANSESEVKFWLESVLTEVNISDFTLEIEGSSEKGDGFSGDILFVNLLKQSNPPKELHLALKCSKRNEEMRAKLPLKQNYENEIYIYNVVYEAFTRFQQEKGITEVFNSIPKYYGAFIGENIEVIVFENLKKSGYDIWDKRKPVTTKHLEMVIEQYGKWHALSVAMLDQKPEEFKQLTDGLRNLWCLFCKATDLTTVFKNNWEEALNLLQDELSDTTTKECLELSEDINKIMLETPVNPNYFSVICHGDCWNNNLMYKVDGDVYKPSRVAIIDWQIASLSSPVLDLSMFLYCCGSKDDLDNLDVLLKKYYSSFSTFCKKLGTDVTKFYPLSELLADWKNVGNYGIIIAITATKICLLNKEETPDLSDALEKGLDMTEVFSTQSKDTPGFKSRALYLIQHAVKWGITKPNVSVSNLEKKIIAQ